MTLIEENHQDEQVDKLLDTLAENVRRQTAQGVSAAPAQLEELAEQYAHLGPRAARLLQGAARDFAIAPDFFAAVVRNRLARELATEEADETQSQVIEGTAIVVEVKDEQENA